MCIAPFTARPKTLSARAALEDGHTVIVDRTNRTRAAPASAGSASHVRPMLPPIAIEMRAPAALCRERNRARNAARRLSEDRMDRMLAALEAVAPDEGFSAICDGG